MNALTAAHQTLPMPSLVRVTNLENGRSVVLRVNDRGPFVRGRIIDVSRRSAQLLGFERQGTARVRVEALAEESQAAQNRVAARNARHRDNPGRGCAPGIRRQRRAAAAARRPVVQRRRQCRPAAALRDHAAGRDVQLSQCAARSKGKITQQPAARPAPPVIAQAAPPGPAPNPAAHGRARRPRRRLHAVTETAASPVTQQAAATAVVTQTGVQATTLFIQAGAFANYDNAYRMSVRLSRYGGTRSLRCRRWRAAALPGERRSDQLGPGGGPASGRSNRLSCPRRASSSTNSNDIRPVLAAF